MRIRVFYSVAAMQYIIGDGRKIPDSVLHSSGIEMKLQELLLSSEKTSNNHWVVDKDKIDAIYQATQQVGMRGGCNRDGV